MREQSWWQNRHLKSRSAPRPRACFIAELLNSAQQNADRNMLNICIARKTAWGTINKYIFSWTDKKIFSVESPDIVSNFFNRAMDAQAHADNDSRFLDKIYLILIKSMSCFPVFQCRSAQPGQCQAWISSAKQRKIKGNLVLGESWCLGPKIRWEPEYGAASQVNGSRWALQAGMESKDGVKDVGQLGQ